MGGVVEGEDGWWKVKMGGVVEGEDGWGGGR